MKIAILQNKIGVDGRSVVIAGMLRICNAHGLIPTIVTFTKPRGDEAFRAQFGPNLQYNLKSLPVISALTRGTAYQTPLLNLLAARVLSGFDVVLNSGRCPYFLPKGPTYIHYVHFPVEASIREEEHFNGFLGSAYTIPLKLLYLGRCRKPLPGIFVANSLFTLNKMRKLYTGVPERRFKVVYPPCAAPDKGHEGAKDIDVASLGSFISDKRQMEQLEIARRLPEASFCIMGGVKSPKYFNSCTDLIQRFQLRNVKLVPNASWDDVSDVLKRAKVFLHTRRGEHFGISTVEAMGYGCVPVVHDSGGAGETVPIDELRFQSPKEAVMKIQGLLDEYSIRKPQYSKLLRENAKQFGTTTFRRQMQDLIFGNV